MRVTGKNPDGTIQYEKIGVTDLPASEFPLSYMAFKFPPPAVLVQRDPTADVSYEIIGKLSKGEFKRYAPEDKDGFWVAPMNPVAFIKLLAKVAHSYAIAEIGRGTFRPILAPFVRGLPLRALEWIGSEPTDRPATPTLHEISLEIFNSGGQDYVVVNLRLFSFLGTPRYQIVVGELERVNQHLLAEGRQRSHTIEIKTLPTTADLFPFAGETINVPGAALS